MDSCNLQPSLVGGEAEERRFDRLRQTPSLRGEALARWRNAAIGVIGGGVLGSVLAPALVRSGVRRCLIVDSDTVAEENLGTQNYSAAGAPKAEALRAACSVIRCGVAVARAEDIRHVGVGELAGLDALVDATDDPSLEWPLTEISNGLKLPMLRVALDGSGEHELGRVQFSHGGGGGACRLCPKSPEQAKKALPRTPCPQAPVQERPPTLAGAGAAMAVAGVALLQLQRYLGGIGAEHVLNSHVVVDLDHFQILPLTDRRSDQCLSGHATWDLLPAQVDASRATMAELFDVAERLTGSPVDFLEPYRHPLCLSARCECGTLTAAAGTRWATPPPCPVCRKVMTWDRFTEKSSWARDEARAAGILGRTAADLGLPSAGAVLVVANSGAPPQRIVLT
jgi:hypothetical protein